MKSKRIDLQLSADEQKRYGMLKAKYDAAATVFNKYLDDLKVKFSEKDKHVASHFSLNAGNETHSYLLLGGGNQRRFSPNELKKNTARQYRTADALGMQYGDHFRRKFERRRR